MIKRTIKSILALLLAVCLFLSPLGTALVRADAITEQGASKEGETAEEESTEAETPADESAAESIAADAQGENAADEGTAPETEVPEGNGEDSVTESVPGSESEGEAEPTENEVETIPEEESAQEETASEQEEEETQEEYAEADWPAEENPYEYEGGLLGALSTELKPKAIISRKVVTLRSAINKDYVLDVKGGRVANGTVIQLYKGNDSDAQKFILQENSDGTVTLVSYISGKVADIKSNSSANGAQVQIYASNGTSAQKFKMVKNSDGTVTLKHSTNGKVIEVSGGTAANGRKIQLNVSSGTKRQKFYIDQKTEYVYDYSGNEWLIRTRINSASVLNVNASADNNIELHSTTRSKMQRFTIIPAGAYYKIKNVSTGKVIAVQSAKAVNGNNVQLSDWKGNKREHLWKIQINSDGSATLVSAITQSMVIDLKSGKTANGTNARIYTSNGSNAQKFFIVNADLDWDAVNTANTGKKVSTSTENQIVLSKIIGAVESGGQNYENGLNYSAYAPPYNSTSIEYTITLGWAQHYGNDAKKLLQMIRDRMNKKKANSFHTGYDKSGQIEAMLGEDVDWLKYKNPNVIDSRYADGRNYGWDPSQYYYKDAAGKIITENGKKLTLKDLIIKLITTEIGRNCQDELFFNNMRTSVEYCEETYTTDVRAVMMYCQIRHLGGKAAAERIFTRIKGVYSVDSIMASLALDRLDTSSSNQVGDDKFWSRHEKCKEFVQKYAIP